MAGAQVTPAHLFIPDPGPDPDGFPHDDYRRVLSRCNKDHPISFSELHAALARDPFTFEIGGNDQGRLGLIIGELMQGGDLIQLGDGSYEATEQGWEKITHHKANEGAS